MVVKETLRGYVLDCSCGSMLRFVEFENLEAKDPNSNIFTSRYAFDDNSFILTGINPKQRDECSMQKKMKMETMVVE